MQSIISRATTLCARSACGLFLALISCATTDPRVSFEGQPGKLVIRIDDKPMATYVYEDEKTPRPYFAHVRSPSGIQVTRNHPPRPDDFQDHAKYHPGLWMALGDLNGHDNWRLHARVDGGDFAERPTGGIGRGTFTVRNRYLTTDGKETICTETCRYTLLTRPLGYLLLWDSTFISQEGDFYFGDEMDESCLSVRVATPIAVKSKFGGRMVNAEGGVNEKGVRERLSDWCDYSGTIEGKQVGITLMSDPANARRPWWHARDYGFLGANPFRSHPERRENTRIVVPRGTPFRLRFGVLIHSGATASYDPQEAYEDFQQQLEPR